MPRKKSVFKRKIEVLRCPLCYLQVASISFSSHLLGSGKRKCGCKQVSINYPDGIDAQEFEKLQQEAFDTSPPQTSGHSPSPSPKHSRRPDDNGYSESNENDDGNTVVMSKPQKPHAKSSQASPECDEGFDPEYQAVIDEMLGRDWKSEPSSSDNSNDNYEPSESSNSPARSVGKTSHNDSAFGQETTPVKRRPQEEGVAMITCGLCKTETRQSSTLLLPCCSRQPTCFKCLRTICSGEDPVPCVKCGIRMFAPDPSIIESDKNMVI